MSQFYLASKSPRRSQILREIGFKDFTILSDNTVATAFAGDEERLPGEDPATYVLRTAREKAFRALERIEKENLPRLPVLASDTAVILGDVILGKPRDREEEKQFLRKLSGATHTVRTVVVLANGAENILEAVSVSSVRFRKLTEAEIDWYSALTEPYDKAGGYAIQGLAAPFVEHIEGSYSGIMGLDAYSVSKLLTSLGIKRSE